VRREVGGGGRTASKNDLSMCNKANTISSEVLGCLKKSRMVSKISLALTGSLKRFLKTLWSKEGATVIKAVNVL